MKNCINCQTQFEGNFCPHCGNFYVEQQENVAANLFAEPQILEDEKPAKKGKVSAAIRLILMLLCDVAAVIILFAGMFRETSMSFMAQLVDTVASSGMIVFLGIWFWGFVKWCIFAIPKTFRAAKKIANTIIPLSFIAFFAEVIICIWLVLVPISIYGLTLSPLAFVFEWVQNNPENIVLPLVILIVSCVGTYFLGKMEFEKLFGKIKAKASK